MEDMRNNYIPESVKNIHLVAICGTAMAALAGMLKEAGFEITGSDQYVYPPMSTFLSGLGIKIDEGFSPENLSCRPDLVIVGNAVSKDNPEIARMFEEELPYCSLPQALNKYFMSGKGALVVTGTHGKTTTAALLSWILATAGLNPGFMVGGILQNLERNYNVGNGAYFVVEGDEYDTAFFDKGPKFLHYTPSRAIVTSIEFDHADIYRDFSHVKKSFSDFVTAMPPEALLVGYDGDVVVKDMLGRASCWTVLYGLEERSPWRLGNVRVEPPWSHFEVTKRGRPFGSFKTSLIGRHNLMNILAVIAVSDDLRIPVEIISQGLETFTGVKRRQEIRGEKAGVIVMDDFAHHPTEVRETISAVDSFYSGNRVIAVFEPRTNSSRRNVFQDRYAEAFDMADLVCIRKPPLLEKIPVDERFSSEKLVEALKKRGKKAYYFDDTEAIIDYLISNVRPGDVLLVMSNGGFDNIHERLLEGL
ncbi:MAG: UDP-N-acetylmuramate:L-alanyl-gamma-D-glutamyl-meso-diaminopimelate ligase [Deltaproteobacteria bacterium]|nr:UDP-N-acetylmuramate:L-alanyl-gamma-D-glutamyl-meso-diaminopimelate ligase [Deltaproteobacteria bacterium]